MYTYIYMDFKLLNVAQSLFTVGLSEDIVTRLDFPAS